MHHMKKRRLELFTYMEVYYNRVRRHSTLGYVSPLQYEAIGDQQYVTKRLT